MYPNIKAEMARRNITMTDLAEHLGITLGTLSLKMQGKSGWLYKEALRIKQYLGVDMPLEVLFAEAA